MTLASVFPLLLALIFSFAADIPDDVPQAVPLDGETPALLTFDAAADESVTITVRRADDDDALNDPIVALIAPDGRWLAYNNNHTVADSALAVQDARIDSLRLPDAGIYTIYVNTYGGIYAGTLTVTLERVDRFRAEIETQNGATITGATTITAHLPAADPYRFTFSAQAGQGVTLTARDMSGTLDPVLRLFDSAGNLLAFNDDHGGDLTLDAFDAQILAFSVPLDGAYTVQVSDFLGRAGDVALTVAFPAP